MIALLRRWRLRRAAIRTARRLELTCSHCDGSVNPRSARHGWLTCWRSMDGRAR